MILSASETDNRRTAAKEEGPWRGECPRAGRSGQEGRRYPVKGHSGGQSHPEASGLPPRPVYFHRPDHGGEVRRDQAVEGAVTQGPSAQRQG